jgi:hypothetical protein
VRTILIGGAVLLVVFVVVFRQRIFVRDPLGKVERNGIAQDGARVYINYPNDVLVEDSTLHGFVLVQNWNKIPGVPKHLACLTGLACWTEADEATVFPLGESPVRASMSTKEVTFADSEGQGIKVGLR